MKTIEQVRRMKAHDATLQWTMRIMGVLLAAASIVFMNQDIFTSTLSMWFFGVCTGLGVITVVSSWLPTESMNRLQENVATRPVQHRHIRRR